MIAASLIITLLALFINIIIGFPLAIYLAELAGPRSKALLKPAIELLAGVPSIVYGFLGVIILVSYLQDSFDMLTGRSILAGSILLGVMFIPYLTTICEDALRAVPSEFKEGSLALGGQSLANSPECDHTGGIVRNYRGRSAQHWKHNRRDHGCASGGGKRGQTAFSHLTISLTRAQPSPRSSLARWARWPGVQCIIMFYLQSVLFFYCRFHSQSDCRLCPGSHQKKFGGY